MAETLTTKDQALQQATALLGDLRTALEKAGAFVLEQAPPLAKEIVAAGRVIHTTLVVLGLILVASAIYALWVRAPRLMRDEKNVVKDYSVTYLKGRFLVPMIIQVAAAIPGLILFAYNIRDMILAFVAPRLYLLEYLMAALRGGCRG